MLEHRMSGEQRRAAIVRAALPVFAKHGFANATTKQLAEAAGVSEALLYKHFPSKESLYSEIKEYSCREIDPVLENVAQLEPSTSTLVHMVYLLMRTLVVGDGDPIGCGARHRLLLCSCLEDGEVPRDLLRRYDACFERLEECLEAAAAAGDLVDGPVEKRNRLLFAHHLACMIAFFGLPERPVVEADREQLFREAVWFVLRGMGLTDAAIATHYNPKALALYFGVNRKRT